MARKKSRKKKAKPRASKKKKPSLKFYFLFLIFLILLGGGAYFYYNSGEKIKNFFSPALPDSAPSLSPEKQASTLLLSTQKHFQENNSLFHSPPVFNDCLVDEHHLSCLSITFGSERDFILGEKLLTEFWQEQGYSPVKDRKRSNADCLALLAYHQQSSIAEVILKKISPSSPPKPSPRFGGKAKIALVIDDLGYNYDEALKLAKLPYPVGFSILPYQTYSQEILQLAHQYHKPALLHMPMEPVNYPAVNPGEGALLLLMSPKQVRETLSQALDSLPGIVGVNNHMGSAFTADQELMKAVIEELKSRGLFFLDSRTTKYTVGRALAEEMGAKTCERKVFLDNLRNKYAIEQKLNELCQKAHQLGSAIGIGHPYPETIEVLEEKLGEISRQGCELVRIEELCQ